MGSDEFYRKRKSGQRLKSGNLMRIICEGEKSEPSYIRAFIKEHASRRMSNFDMHSPERTDPLGLINEAIKAKQEGYDKVICVFDKDTHLNFFEAATKGRQKGIKMIISEPCFEFWLLLHFKYTDKSFGGGAKTPCQECIGELKEYFCGYKKGDKNIHEKTKDKIEIATRGAKETQRGEGSKTNFTNYLK
ncbi:MAG: RloB family protein [Wolinella sp.]